MHLLMHIKKCLTSSIYLEAWICKLENITRKSIQKFGSVLDALWLSNIFVWIAVDLIST